MSKMTMEEKLRARFQNNSPHAILMGENENSNDLEEENGKKNKEDKTKVEASHIRRNGKAEKEERNQEEEKASLISEQEDIQKSKKNHQSQESSTQSRKSENKKKDKNKKVGFRRNKPSHKDRFEQNTIYTHKTLFEAMDLILAWGEKQRFVNMAFQKMLLEDELCSEYLKEQAPELYNKIEALTPDDFGN